MFGVTITVRCNPTLGKAITGIKKTADSCRTRIVNEVSLKAPIVTQQVLDGLEVVSESLYAGTVKLGNLARRLSGKACTVSKPGLAWLFRALRAILAVLLAKLSTFMVDRKSLASLVGVVALGMLLRRSPVLRFLFLMWRVYKLARHLAATRREQSPSPRSV